MYIYRERGREGLRTWDLEFTVLGLCMGPYRG